MKSKRTMIKQRKEKENKRKRGKDRSRKTEFTKKN